MSEQPQEIPTQELTVDPTEEMFKALGSVAAAEPTAASDQRTDYEQTVALHRAQEDLVNQAVQDPSLVHSAAAVFTELRYYDAMRMRAYAVDIYKKLVDTISTTGTVPLVVKKTLPPVNALALPMHINPNELPMKVKVSVYNHTPSVDVEIVYEYKSGLHNTYTTSTRYMK